MAKEITVTFEDGGIFEGFANTYTLNNEVTYYFSFDRDYRVQATDNAITLQEYRNAGAWYPIDIITNFAVTEISCDVTKDWVNQNFVKKAGDTMTGTLKFNFGTGDLIVIGQSSTTNRGLINFNGNMYFKNEDNKIIGSFVSTSNLTLNLFQASNGFNSNIYFRNYESDASGLSRSISYTEFRNNDNNSTWEFNGKYQANSTWWFKHGGVYFDTWAYWRSNDIINTIIQNNGGIRVYNEQHVQVNKYGYGDERRHYTAYKYDGRTSYSNVSGEDPRFRVVGYTNFVDSVECYNKITIKTEGQNTASLILSKGYLYIYDDNAKLQYMFSPSRFDIYNNHAVICHNGTGGGGADDVQATFQYNGVRTYNYSNNEFAINSGGAIRIDSTNGLTAHSGQGMYLTSDRTVSITHGAGAGYDIILNNPNGGSVNLTTLYAACNNTFYSESMLNALNACLGHIFDNIGHKYYVAFSGTSYSTGGGSSRGGGVGRK